MRCKLVACAPAIPGAWAVPSDSETVFLIRYEQWQGPAPDMGLPKAQTGHWTFWAPRVLYPWGPQGHAGLLRAHQAPEMPQAAPSVA